MPQMAPLSWINLFLSFSIILVVISSINYFHINYKTVKKESVNNKTPNNWKW
uniref:ATP synthase complex subunit 8 n=1 Tax=Drilus flavescens TaxID=295522 RepID=E3VT91_9COLE|nr:ATP synthase F0 subunit 8 [Drilus flavescens]